MIQNEITKLVQLLDSKGNILEPGYAKKALFNYNRNDIKANGFRIKEWDYYCVLNEHFGIALTVADNSYMGLDSITLFDFDQKTEITQSFMQWLTFGKKNLPSTSTQKEVYVSNKTHQIRFYLDHDNRILEFNVSNFKENTPLSGKIILSQIPSESMVIATPFDKEKHFYYNQKINCMRAEGIIMFGSMKFVFEPSNSFGVLDWGRGVWTYANTWYWGSASGLIDNKTFGFNIGFGFGNTSAATENMLFYDGKAHKLSQVEFKIPKKADGTENYLSPWKFISDDGRFEMDFIPLLDRSSNTKVLVLESKQHQVFGHFTGYVILDDGTKLIVNKLIGFAEKVMNRW
ncbi:MAG TPA: DUF2804 domain-containing protein [Erysipelotrichaceae bacterium]|nr:DUF2804 domain-containing protein [Erysipelotrichaceae bacterium]